MRPSRFPFLSVAAFVVAVLIQLLTVSHVAGCTPPKIIEDTFRVSEASPADYAAFMANFDVHVNSTSSRLIEFRPVLGEQFVHSKPATWLQVNLVGAGNNRTALLIRSDNLYVSGFSNKWGHWFAFRREQHTMPYRGSTSLNFAGGYRDLFPQEGHAGLADLPISRQEAIDHLATLANFAGGADENLKRSLAFFILLISEAERFVEIREAVMERWAGNDDPQIIRRMIISRVVHWSEISCALLSWDRLGRAPWAWEGILEARKIYFSVGIRSPREALSRINPILKPAHGVCSSGLLHE